MAHELFDYAETVKQQKLLTALDNGLSMSAAAKQLGMAERNAYSMMARLKKRAAQQGYAPAHDLTKPVPSGLRLKGASTLYNSDGEIAAQWVKSERDSLSDTTEALREIADELLEPVRGRSKTTKAPKGTTKQALTSYCIGDAHVGMRSWGDETGDDHDLEIGTADLCGAIDRLVDSAQPTETALFAQLGDYFHMDDATNLTPGNKNALDVDGRYLKVVKAGIQTMRYLIDRALERHKKVIVRNVSGNHDPHASVALTLALSAYYEKNRRVQIEESPKPFWCFRWHNNLIGITHGDGIKLDKMPQVLAVEAGDDWLAKYKYVYSGHIHTRRTFEEMGVLVESFRTLAGRDAWHSQQGYHSGREMVAITLDAEHGEIERHTCSVERARAA
ncbi:MAG: hypothetical protein KJN60_00250 [Boseongicola sp.]|nr:hypothetical protein [Boseongicola sp.]